jgi:hypothetical protein
MILDLRDASQDWFCFPLIEAIKGVIIVSNFVRPLATLYPVHALLIDFSFSLRSNFSGFRLTLGWLLGFDGLFCQCAEIEKYFIEKSSNISNRVFRFFRITLSADADPNPKPHFLITRFWNFDVSSTLSNSFLTFKLKMLIKNSL